MSTLADDVFFTRTWWTADVVARSGERISLVVRRGARLVLIWRNSLATFEEIYHPSARLAAEAGDAFVVVGPQLDETLIGTVAIASDARLELVLRDGTLDAATTTVRLLEVSRSLRSSTKARRRAA